MWCIFLFLLNRLLSGTQGFFSGLFDVVEMVAYPELTEKCLRGTDSQLAICISHPWVMFYTRDEITLDFH